MRLLLQFLLLWPLAGLALHAAEPDNPEKTAAKLMTPAADRAVDRGLIWLAGRQQDDGSFGTGTYQGNTAITGLAGMAFMTAGSTPGRGPYGRQVGRCVDYLLAHTQESGFINYPRGAGHGPMYGHGFATLFLAETYGMSLRGEVREALQRAVKLIVNTQNKEGGWRYYPQRSEADVSVTVCQVMALRAARNAGLHVPKETVDQAVAYIQRCQNTDGGFRYMPTNAERDSGFPRSAAAVAGLNSAGIYDGPEVRKGIEYLLQFLPRAGVVQKETTYYEYAHYYAVQAMWQAGGDVWTRWYSAVRDDLISRQRPDGSWSSSINAINAEYSTAMCLIVLAMPNNHLPILQR